MIKISAIKPLSDFVRNTKSHIAILKKTREPEILTVNGEAAIIVQDAASYQEMAALAEQARQDSRLQEAMQYFRKGGLWGKEKLRQLLFNGYPSKSRIIFTVTHSTVRILSIRHGLRRFLHED